MPAKGSKKQFCPKGHDTFICGRDKKGMCQQCKREWKSTSRHKKQFCSRKHDTFICGRHNSGQCKECSRLLSKLWQKENPEKANIRNNRWRTNNPKKAKEIAKRGYEKHKEKRKIKNQENNWRRYKIKNLDGSPFTLKDYQRAFEEQNGKCKICGAESIILTRALSVDHDHLTGCFRSLVCDGCNLKIGVVESKLFQTVLTYIANFSTEKRNKKWY